MVIRRSAPGLLAKSSAASKLFGSPYALVIDDDHAARTRLEAEFRELGARATGAALGTSFVDIRVLAIPDWVVVDPGRRSSFRLIREIRQRFCATQIIVIAAITSPAGAFRAAKLGAAGYFTKPVSAREILGLVRPDSVDLPVARAPSLAAKKFEHVDQVLSACGGNKAKAARVLGVGRATLYRMMSKR